MNKKHILAGLGILNLIACGPILPTDYYIKVAVMTVVGIALLILSEKMEAVT